jgi:hypothetical protein
MQGGSTSPKAMRYRRKRKNLIQAALGASTRPEVAFHRMEKSAREFFAGASIFLVQTNSAAMAWWS